MSSASNRDSDGIQVLSLGLMRSGTASAAEAYRILGYKRVMHGLDKVDDWRFWVAIDKLADATFANLPTYRSSPTPDLDSVFGGYDVVTDLASFYAEELIERYPNAKVVVTVRDFEPWRESVIGAIFTPICSPAAVVVRKVVEPLLGYRSQMASCKMFSGLFKGDDRDTWQCNMRRAYDEHHALIKRLVPPERLLFFRVSDGWEPLCAFLDKPVPEAAFPRKNESAELKEVSKKVVNEALIQLAKAVCVVGVAAYAAAYAYPRLARK